MLGKEWSYSLVVFVGKSGAISKNVYEIGNLFLVLSL